MLDTCHDLGFAVNPRKVVPPTTQLEFLGITLDTFMMEMRISDERLDDVMSELSKWQSRKSCTKRELLSLIGKLNFVSRVVKPGRTFVRRMIELSKKIKHLHYKVKLNKQFQKDIQWWLQYLPDWNGKCMIPNTAEYHHLYTDAIDIGFGGYCEGDWFAEEYTSTDERKDKSINWREIEAVAVAAATWGHQWQGKRVIFHCDNDCIVQVVNSGTCRSPEIMDLVRTLFFISARHEFSIHCQYINTNDNVLADALSRMDFARFHRECLHASPHQVIPACITGVC